MEGVYGRSKEILPDHFHPSYQELKSQIAFVLWNKINPCLLCILSLIQVLLASSVFWVLKISPSKIPVSVTNQYFIISAS